MTRAEEYKYLTERVRARARMADGRGLASEWNHLADCYAMLAKQSERKEQGDQVPPGDREGTLNKKIKLAG